jgi:hypothetical protein
MEADPVGKAGCRCACFGDLVLLDAQRDAGPRLLSQIKTEPTPAGADVECLEARPVEQQLGCNVALLALLRLFEAVVLTRESGARILAVLVEKEVLEMIRQIIQPAEFLTTCAKRLLQHNPPESCHRCASWRVS